MAECRRWVNWEIVRETLDAHPQWEISGYATVQCTLFLKALPPYCATLAFCIT